ncbi:MAG: type II secretion system F family protein [Smithella sp.]|jgi:tight adherence protein C|nr:type II secretion system F family protein [Smithella sp.]
MTFFIAAIAFIAVALIFAGAYMFFRKMEEQTAITEKAINFSGTTDAIVVQDETILPAQPVARLFARVIRYFGNRLKPKEKEEISLIQKKFQKAGLRKRNVLVSFFGSKAICAICLSMGFVAVIILSGIKFPFLGIMVSVILLSLYGFYLPNLWLSMKISRRQGLFLQGFPDALDLLAVCVEAGMGLDSAIKRVGEEMRLSNKIISEEFGLLNLEMRAGKERKDAMKSMADRVDLEDVSSWVTMLIQTDRLGTSISQALRVHSDSLRVKRSQRLEEMAAKVPVKLLFPTIFCIFPSLFVVILGPAFIRILRVLSEL